VLLVWLKYCIASSGLSMIVAEQPTEALPPHHWTRLATNCPLPHDELVVEPLMISLGMIMGQVLLDRIIQRAFSSMTICARASSLMERTNRSQWAFKFGLRGGKRTGSTPLSFSNASNPCVNLVSRLWSR
jgi:hypothetical protein